MHGRARDESESMTEQLETTAWADVVSQWNRSHGPRLQIRDCDLQWNLSQQNLVRYRTTRLARVPVIVAVATPQGVAAGLLANSLWLSLWGEIPPGTETGFLRAFQDLAEREGKSRLVIGADEFHFLPGVPLGEPGGQGERFAQSLRDLRFEGSEVADFIGSLKTEPVATYIAESNAQAEEQGWRFEPVLDTAEKAAMAVFLAREFPGRWTREFQFWAERVDTRRAFWMALRLDSDAILGFARIAIRDRLAPLDTGWSPGALRLPLRAADDESRGWTGQDGCLGPIGVASSQRGQGAGKVLLGKTLETLRKNNAGRVCIDWTNAFKYYLPLRLEQARTYWAAWKNGLD